MKKSKKDEFRWPKASKMMDEIIKKGLDQKDEFGYTRRDYMNYKKEHGISDQTSIKKVQKMMKLPVEKRDEIGFTRDDYYFYKVNHGFPIRLRRKTIKEMILKERENQ